MAISDDQDTIQVLQGEKITTVMIYTQNSLVWGQVVTVDAIRVSTWLRTQAKPQYILLHNAQVLLLTGDKLQKPLFFRELHLPSAQVIGFHIKPPDCDPLNYEPNEPMRKMVPVTALVGSFRFKGMVRMSTQTTLDKYLDVAKEDYTSFYDLEISQTIYSSLGIIRTPFALLCSEDVFFSSREE